MANSETTQDTVERLYKIWYSGGVKRYHIMRSIEQNIAEHSWGVALLMSQLFPEVRKELIVAALTHDCSEVITGDIPATFKWFASEDFRESMQRAQDKFEKVFLGGKLEITEEEYLQLKFCDYLELIFFCRYGQYGLNKMECSIVLQNAYNYLATKLLPRFSDVHRTRLHRVLTVSLAPLQERHLEFSHVGE